MIWQYWLSEAEMVCNISTQRPLRISFKWKESHTEYFIFIACVEGYCCLIDLCEYKTFELFPRFAQGVFSTYLMPALC